MANRFSFQAQLINVADQNYRRLHRDAKQRQQAQNTGDAERSVRQLESNQRADGFRQHHAKRDGDRKFEIAVQREENQENQHQRQRTNDHKLRLGFQQFAVFAAPIQGVTRRQLHFFGYRALAIVDHTFQVATDDGELNSDVARIIFAINKGCAAGFANGRQLGERDGLPGRRGHQQVADVVRGGAILRLHAHHQVEEFFALNHLRGSLPADGRLDHGFHVGNVDSIARNFGAIRFNNQAGLTQFTHNGQFRVFGDFVQHLLYL